MHPEAQSTLRTAAHHDVLLESLAFPSAEVTTREQPNVWILPSPRSPCVTKHIPDPEMKDAGSSWE